MHGRPGAGRGYPEVARPTAVNLRRGPPGGGRPEPLDAAELRRLALAEARAVLRRIVALRRDGRGRLAELAGRSRLLTHCNTGRLATAGLGTALGVVYAKAAAAEPVQVLASETRPLLQGACSTAWELVNAGIPVIVVADTAAGAARPAAWSTCWSAATAAANGDTANKIGTYSLAVLARANQVLVPWSGRRPASTPRLPAGPTSRSSSAWRPRSAPSPAGPWPRRERASGTLPTSPRPPWSRRSSPTPGYMAPVRAVHRRRPG